MSYNFIPIKTDDETIKEITNLMRITFPHSDKYTEEFIRWQYRDNPDGQIVGYNAYYNDVLAGHYAIMPIVSSFFGKEEKGLLSLNTATHPEHRGKRLFSVLADKSYTAATEQGYGFVVGIANAQSTPGFLKRLGFELVGKLDAKLGFGKIVYKKEEVLSNYYRLWKKESIDWRLSNPELTYKVKNNTILASADRLGIQAVLMNFGDAHILQDNQVNLGHKPIRLWIGIDESIDWGKSFYFNIPKRLRPSPLNLIFKDLTSANRTIDFSEVKLSALDFDAY